MTRSATARDARLARWVAAPARGLVLVVAGLPLAWTFWESLHLHDLRMPWRGRPFVGLGHYAAALSDARLAFAALRTLAFALVSVAIEILLGLALALGLDALRRARGTARTLLLLPWALPTVVAGLLWRFAFEAGGGGAGGAWLAHPWLAWVPIVAADVWKTTPFVSLLLLAGLQGIDPALHEAARVDGAGPWQRLRHVTLPLLAPALVIALVFRLLDALRVFDLVFVLTNGGPGIATEPVALYAFETLLGDLRFGYASAISTLFFLASFFLAWIYIRLVGRSLVDAR